MDGACGSGHGAPRTGVGVGRGDAVAIGVLAAVNDGLGVDDGAIVALHPPRDSARTRNVTLRTVLLSLRAR